MVDIFIAYAQQDRERIGPIVRTLEQQSWSVWRYEGRPDPDLPQVQLFERETLDALAAARCIVVVWSCYSYRSDWIYRIDEYRKRKSKRPRLFSVLLDEDAKEFISLKYRVFGGF